MNLYYCKFLAGDDIKATIIAEIILSSIYIIATILLLVASTIKQNNLKWVFFWLIMESIRSTITALDLYILFKILTNAISQDSKEELSLIFWGFTYFGA